MQDIVVAVYPRVGAPALVVVGVAIGQVHVPHHHLEARVLAVTTLEELAAQAVSVHVVAQFHGQLVVDKILHIQVLVIDGSLAREIGPQRLFHLVDAARDVCHLLRCQFLVVGRLVLEVDIIAIVSYAGVAHGMVFGYIGHLAVGAVHLHDVATGDGVTTQARVRQIQARLALGDDLGKDKHAIVGAIQVEFAVTTLRRVLHPRARHLKGQQVAHHALVGIGGKQCPVVILAHTQNIHLLFHAAIL